MTRRTYLEAVRRPNPRRAGAEGESSPSPRTDTPGCDDQEATDRRDNLVYALSDWLAFDCVKEVFSDLDEEEWCLFDTAAAGVTGEDTNIDANVNNKEVEAVSCVSCRAHFDPALTGKENKEALKEEVAWALAGLARLARLAVVPTRRPPTLTRTTTPVKRASGSLPCCSGGNDNRQMIPVSCYTEKSHDSLTDSCHYLFTHALLFSASATSLTAFSAAASTSR